MSGGGSDMGTKLDDKDGKTPERRFGPNRGKPLQVGPNENGVLFLGENGTIFVSRFFLPCHKNISSWVGRISLVRYGTL